MGIKRDDTFITKVSKSIWVLGVFIVLLCGASIYSLNLFISSTYDNARVINRAGRQRAISQLLTKELYKYRLQQNYYPKDIGVIAQQWSKNHNAFQNRTKKIGISIYNTPKIDSLFTEIQQSQSQLQSLLLAPNQWKAISMDSIVAWNRSYLAGMDAIVTEYQIGHEKNLTQYQFFGSISYLFIMAFGIGSFLFLILPLIRKSRQNIQDGAIQQLRIEAVIENTQDAIWSISKDFRLLTFNSAYSRLCKAHHGNVPTIGADAKGFFLFGEDVSDYERALKGNSFSTEAKVVKNGKTKLYQLSFNPILDKNTIVSGCCVRQSDLTQRRKTLKMFKESERKLKEAQQIANMGNWHWDMQKDDIFWSDQLYTIFGQDKDHFETNYASLMGIIHPDDRKLFNDDVDRCIKKRIKHDIVHRIVKKNGELRFIHQKGKAFYDHEGNPIRMAGTAQDVTKTIEANKKIIKQNTELQNFVYVISHNLRRPVSNLLALHSVYNRGINKENDDILDKIESSCTALDQTIKDLNLSLSLKAITPKEFKPIALHEILSEVKILLASEITNSQTTIFTKLDNVNLYGVKSYFMNILYNLILNSITYRKEGVRPKITIRLTGSFDWITLSVRDNGIGIDLSPERRKKIFDMYGRLSGKTNGQGLGLYLVKTQVDAMGGDIDAISTKGKGTTFILKFKNRKEDLWFGDIKRHLV